MAECGTKDWCGSGDAYMTVQRDRTNRPRGFYVCIVQITAAGRQRLTAACTTKLTDGDEDDDAAVNFRRVSLTAGAREGIAT